MKSCQLGLLLAASLLLGGCISIQPSTPLPAAGKLPALTVERALPKQLPDKSSPFPHSQFVLLAPENFGELVSPIPFVADLVTAGIHSEQARAFEAKYRDIHPFLIARANLQASPLLSGIPGDLVLKPFVFLQQCSDGRARLAYVFHVTFGDWVGRYVYHLPTTFAAEEMSDPSPAVLAVLQRELTEGATVLRGVLERDAAGLLPVTGPKAKVGSRHLAGIRALGLIGTSLMAAKVAQVVEETPDHVVVRIRGDMKLAASAGGLYFGVHWLRRDQLDTFERL